MNKLTTLAIATVTAATCLTATPASATASGSAAHADAASCVGATESCEGTLSVPLDWSDPDGPRIEVAYAWYPRRDQSTPAQGTILANLAGPAPSIGVLNYDQVLGSARDHQDLLLVDPRGHGKSTPLRCADLDPFRPDRVRECADGLGPKVAHFGSASVARDIDAVRAALGIDQLSLVGHSGGTVVLPAYAARYPDRVRAMYLSGTFTYDENGYTADPLASPAVFRAGLADLDLWCRRSTECDRLAGDSATRLDELTRQLRANPDPAVPTEALTALHTQLYDPAYGRDVNAAAAAYLDGDPAPLHRLIASVRATWKTETPDPSMAGILGTLCVDGDFAFDRGAAPEQKRRQLAAYFRDDQPFRPLRADEVGVWRDGSYLSSCASWAAAPDAPPLPADAELPDVPTFVVNGDLDTTTPERGGRELAERIPGATYVEVPGGSHLLESGSARVPYVRCVQRSMRGFLDDPKAPLTDPRCDGRTTRALGAFPRTAGELPTERGAERDRRAPARSGELADDDRALVSTAYATAADATVRLDPGATYTALLKKEDGLRGGTVEYAEDRMNATLESVRFVEDVVVDGTIRLDENYAATARLTVTGSDGADRRIELRWPALKPAAHQPVTGTLDGERFRTTVSAF